MSSIPKTAAGFEKDFNQLKKDSANVYQYVKHIPLKTLEGLFRTSEVLPEILAGVLQALSKHGLDTEDSCQHAVEFLVSLSKASNFDMTLMFANETEKKEIKKILAAAKK